MSTNTPLPTEPPTSAPTQTPVATENPTAKPEVEAIDVLQIQVIENAPNRNLPSEYLSSEKYLTELKDKNSKGLLPKKSTDPFYISQGKIKLNFDNSEPSNFFTNNGFQSSIEFSDSSKWNNPDKQPWKIVDAGNTKIGETDLRFYTVRWDNPDDTNAYWLYTFPPFSAGETLNEEYERLTGLNTNAYPTPKMYMDIQACNKYYSTYRNAYKKQNFSDYCTFIGNKQVPVDDLTNWNNTGILKNQTTIFWSGALPQTIR